jgi:DNA-binding MarR family transcriptional regulator
VPKRSAGHFVDRLSAVTRAVRAVAAREYAALEIGTAQAKFLRQIGEHGAMSQAELARATDTAPTLTGRGLEPLIARGWVRRKRSAADRREYLVELTAAGKRARERVEAARAGIATRIEAALTERDVTDFERIADKVLAAIDGEAASDHERVVRTAAPRKKR